MRGSATLAMVLSSACMIEASITEPVMSPRCCTPPVAAAFTNSVSRGFCRRGIVGTKHMPAMPGIDLYRRAQPAVQRVRGIGAVELDAHRQALHHLYPVAGRVFRRQHRKLRTRSRA